MDYREKYEQALENIKKIKAANKDNKSLVDFIEYKYPELKESEDEKIRKALIQHIKYKVSVISGWRKEELIAWLEKQGEQIDIVNKEYWRGYREGKQLILDKYADLEKQDEQKPAWSEEDEKEISKLIKFFMWEDTGYRFTIEDCLEATNWLKSLKERMKGE